jgi:hypothetical protein
MSYIVILMSFQISIKGRTIRKVHEFQRARIFFQNFLLCWLFFFLNNPLLEFFFFPKIVGEGGGVKKFFSESKIFSRQIKKGRKNFFQTNISLVNV